MIEKNSSVVNIFTKIPFIPMETYLRNGAGLFDLKFHKFVAQSQKMNKFEQRTQHFYLISEKIFYLFKLNLRWRMQFIFSKKIEDKKNSFLLQFQHFSYISDMFMDCSVQPRTKYWLRHCILVHEYYNES